MVCIHIQVDTSCKIKINFAAIHGSERASIKESSGGGGAGIPLGNENRLDFLSELVECGGVTREIWCRGMSRGREHWER